LAKKITIEVSEEDAEDVIYQIQRLADLLERLDFDRICDLLSQQSELDKEPKKARRR
jgi:hypothetical protein